MGSAAGGASVDGVTLPSATKVPATVHADSVYKRAVWLMSDAVVLTIAAPFIAIWWFGRAIKRIAVSNK